MMLRIFRQYYPIRNIFFVCIEGVVIFGSVLLATWISLGWQAIGHDAWLLLKVILINFTCQICLYYNDLYDIKATDSFLELGIRLFQALGVAAIILACIYYIFPEAIIARGTFSISIGLCILFIVSWRFCYMWVLSRGFFNQRIIVLGSGRLADDIIKEVTDRKDCGYAISLVAREEQNGACKEEVDIRCAMIKKGYVGLCQMAKELAIHKIVVAITEKRGAFPSTELLNCRVAGIDILEGVSFYEMLTGKLIVEQIKPAWLIFSEGFQKSKTRRFLKRLIDLTLSPIMLVLLLPVIALIAVLIKIDSKGPAFFSQERVGENKKTYRVYKFRSMVADAEKLSGPVWAKGDDDRVTRVGRWIRKLRIDEIPQLWNVLKGEMSFVGPRPEREFFVKELEQVVPYYHERFNVKPGITGWAQVSYGYGASVEDAVEKLNYDLFYIKNMSIFMDLMIILRTIKIVLFGKGAR